MTIVTEKDLRPNLYPATPNRCGYCPSTLGEEHVFECVCNRRPVKMKATIEFEFVGMVPASWDDGMILFSYNEGTWCADNLYDAEFWPQDCICPNTKITLVDPTSPE
jgi:hypothetical protein